METKTLQYALINGFVETSILRKNSPQQWFVKF